MECNEIKNKRNENKKKININLFKTQRKDLLFKYYAESFSHTSPAVTSLFLIGSLAPRNLTMTKMEIAS